MRCLVPAIALVFAVIAGLGPRPPESGFDAALQTQDQPEAKDWSTLKLEDLFPEKSLFGPSSRGAAFSCDGRYAAYLYRPYKERRHGNDLWLFDPESGTATRLTSVTVMARFQESTREVREDRIKKAKEARKKEKQEEKQEEKQATEDADRNHGQGVQDGSKDHEEKGEDGAESDGAEQGQGNDQVGDTDKHEEDGDEEKLGDWVSDDDADDEKAPRYAGISSFEWSPVAPEFLFVSQNDIYRYNTETHEVTRLTQTRARESDVQYLPDGSGYTYLLDGALLRVTFGSHLLDQLDPRLPNGERMTSYRLSPDGQRLTFLAEKSSGTRGDRTVSIAQYRDRFMQVREVPRHVSDDPMPKREISVYTYQLRDQFEEDGVLSKVHTHEVTGPRDIFQVPEWAPDSSRVAFAVYEQSTGIVEIREAIFPEPGEGAEVEAQPEVVEAEHANAEGEGDDDGGSDDGIKGGSGSEEDEDAGAGEEPQDDEELFKVKEARVAYRFLHDGGPDTPWMIRPYYLADSRRLVFITELSGFRHLHLLDPVYQSQEQLTHGHYEVYPIDISDDHQRLFATATKEHPTQTDVYSIDLPSGELHRLSTAVGSYSSAAVSQDGRRALAQFASYESLPELAALDTEQGTQTVLTHSHPDKLREITQVRPEFFSYTNRHGHEIYGQMFKPDDWTPNDKRPLLVYVYGGPLGTTKMVRQGDYSSAAYFFAYYMAKKHGFVTCTIDPRGMSGYGSVFEKANFEQAGKPQVEDLTDGVRFLIEHHGVDPQRVGIHGWSFGGFQTQMCMYTEPDVFKVGIAGAGPTEWENYNSWYSTGTIGKSREGHTDLEKYSLLPKAKNLKGKLLLVHGMEDSNVLYQDTVRVYRELLKAGKETLVELFLDPTGGHGLGGDVKTLGRYRKYEEFLLRNLGVGGPAPAACPTDSCAPESAGEDECAGCTDSEACQGKGADAEDEGQAEGPDADPT